MPVNTYADIFGIENLKLNATFKQSLPGAETPLALPEQFQADLMILLSQISDIQLIAQQQQSFNLATDVLAICHTGLQPMEKKRLWSVLSERLDNEHNNDI